jgi:hypothetical protein
MSAEDGQTDCDFCKAGFHAPGQGAAECLPCGVGTFSQAGAQLCSPCEVGKYSQWVKSSSCTPCPSSKTSASGSSSCSESVAGFFIVPGTEDYDVLECPHGSLCPGEGLFPVPLSGYWVDRSEVAYVADVYRCQRQTCKGGTETTSDGSQQTSSRRRQLGLVATRPSCWTQDGLSSQECGNDNPNAC